MKFVVSCFIVLQLTFEITKGQSFSFNSPHVQFESAAGKPSGSYNFHQYGNLPPVNNGKSFSVYDKELKPYENKNDVGQKYSYYHTPNSWNQNEPPHHVNQIPQLIYQNGNQPSKRQGNNYLSGIITNAGDAVKETADENHNAFKNSIDSLVAAGVANTNAGIDLIQSGLAFGTSFPRFGSKFLSQSDNNRQKNGFNIGGFSF